MPSSSASAANDASATSSQAANISQTYAHFIGKQFQLSKHSVYVEEIIAEGGFSIVFLVKSNLNGRKYALKRMYVNNEYDLDSCKLEIQIIKSLSEHNKKILKYVDSSIQRVQGSDDIYEILLLTKYCRLGGLVQLMNERLAVFAAQAAQRPLLTEPELLKIFCDICESVADLHSRGIIHRDLKIENILIDDTPDLDANLTDKQFKQQQRKMSNSTSGGQPNFNYVLCDFGSATNKIFDRRAQNYSSHQVQQIADEIQKYTTLSYRSPEMVDLYSNKPITVKSDIWALGCLLYKMCFSQMPFGDSLLAIQEGRYTIPDAKANFYSKQLVALINYTLEPDPLKRPDIYQVSCLAFQLAKRPCPIKNFDNAEAPPDINSLPAPLTESEWRKVSTTSSSSFAQQQKTAAAAAAKAPSEVVTTVNPRERPKANMNPGSSMLLANPITSSSASAAAAVNSAAAVKHRAQSSSIAANQNSKLSISIKPPPPPPSSSAHQQQSAATTTTSELTSQMHQLGFDDDFGSANSSTLVSSAATTPLVPHQPPPPPPIQSAVSYQLPPTMTHSVSHNNQLYRHQQQQPPHGGAAATSANNMAGGGGGNATPNSASALDKKSHHRRSASHSSTILLNPQLTPHQQQPQYHAQQQQVINPYYQQTAAGYMNPAAVTPRLPAPIYDPVQVQQQQLKYQLLQIQQQQQLQQQQQQQQQFYYQNITPTNSLMYPATNMVQQQHHVLHQSQLQSQQLQPPQPPHHARSTSTSPNSASQQQQQQSESAQVMELSEKSSSDISSNKPPRHHHSHVNMSYNPFGDCFGPPPPLPPPPPPQPAATNINDNELFGLEFDRIRHRSIATAASAADTATYTMQPADDDLSAPTTTTTSKTTTTSSEPIQVRSGGGDRHKFAGHKSAGGQHQQLSSSASSNSSSTSFSQSSSLFELRKLSSGSSTSSSSTKSPSPGSLNPNSKACVVKSKQKPAKHSSKRGDPSRLVSNYVFGDDDDPFRSAPFKPTSALDRLSNSSSHSSTSMATITNRSATKSKTKSKAKGKSKRSVESAASSKTSATATTATAGDAPAAAPQTSTTPKQQFNSDASAFQPYRRPPDPFLSAPFEN